MIYDAAMDPAAKETFQSFWFGSRLSPYENICLTSFIDAGYRFHLYTYDRDLAVPLGVELLPAADILDVREVFFYQNVPGRGSPAAFASLFRYKLLENRGGWWVDTDVLCLSSKVPSCTEFYAH